MSGFSRGVSGARTILLAVRIDRLSSYPEATSGKFEALARISCQADNVRFNLRHPDIEHRRSNYRTVRHIPLYYVPPQTPRVQYILYFEQLVWILTILRDITSN